MILRLALLMSFQFVLGGCSKAKLEQIPPEPPPPRDDKLAVNGRICTDPPDELAIPLRVLFVVDTSESMEVTDPADPETGEVGRVTAVRETWSRLIEEGRNVRVGIVGFDSSARSGTTCIPNDETGLCERIMPDDPVRGARSYFTEDVGLLDDATEGLLETCCLSNYVNALNEAYFEIRREMDRSNERTLARSRFVVIFVSDGLPDDGGSSNRDRGNNGIIENVRRLKDLARLFGVKDFQFHSVFMASDRGSVADAPAQELLLSMAEAGGGSFRSIPNGERLDFVHIDIAGLKRLFSLSSFIAFNTQMVRDKNQIPEAHISWIDGCPSPQPVEDAENGCNDRDNDGFCDCPPAGYKDLNNNSEIDCGDPLFDTDADGLADVIEDRVGTDPFNADTDGDGLRDGVEWRLGISGLDPFDPTDSGCYAPERVDDAEDECEDSDNDGLCDCPLNEYGICSAYIDTDGDGLRDCEEIYIGTDANLVDTDSDGMPDPVEYRFGTDTVSPDFIGDLDWDLTPNGVELRTGGNPVCDDSDVRSRVAYNYELEEEGIVNVIDEEGVEQPVSCYDFRVRGVTLLPTRSIEQNAENEVEPEDGGSSTNSSGPGRNRILFFAGQQAFDEPDIFAGWKIACVEASYQEEGDVKIPPSGRMELSNDDFKKAENFDPNLHCLGRQP